MPLKKEVRKRTITGIIILVLVVVPLTLFRNGHKRTELRFGEVKTGVIKSTITSSGVLQPCDKVEVGTPISGTFSKVYVSYNKIVKKGDLLAEIDSRILIASKQEAESNILQLTEKLTFSRTDFKQKQQLFNSGYLPDIEYLKARTAYFSDSSSLLAARANLLKASTTLEYATITAPISGTVIECNAKEGQTVVSNMNTPVLFVIAQDLSSMEIHATVDESDISHIQEGQAVEFSVLAYPDSVFYGKVKQIRLRPNIIQNVVNYIVVINTSNSNHLLMPGMTATIDFIVHMKKDIMVVPKSALDFQPSEEMMKRFQKKKPGSVSKLQNSSDYSNLWFIGDGNELNMVQVKTGLSDDNFVEITSTDKVYEGMQVITGMVRPSDAKGKSSGSNGQIMNINAQPGGGAPPPPPGGP